MLCLQGADSLQPPPNWQRRNHLAATAANTTRSHAHVCPDRSRSQIGDRFTQLRDELEQSIEETIRAERFGVLPGTGAAIGPGQSDCPGHTGISTSLSALRTFL